jgi:hypothetical protein
MYLKTFVLLFFFFSSSNIFSQIEFIDNLTNWMADWETTYKPNDETTCKETLNIDWAYHNRFIKFDIAGGWAEHPADKYYTTEYITLNAEKKIVGFYMNNSSHDQLAPISGTTDENKIKLKLKSESENWEEIWEYKDGKLFRTLQGIDKNTKKAFKVEAIFTKKQ